MIIVLYRFLLTFNSTLLFVMVWAIKWLEENTCLALGWLVLVALGFIAANVLLAALTLKMSKTLDTDNNVRIETIQLANSEFIPTYLGYCFVALSVQTVFQFCIMYVLIFVFVWLSKLNYYNPIYLVLGYKYYHATTPQGTKVFLITKQEIKNPKQASFASLKRINNMSFIEIGRDKQ